MAAKQTESMYGMIVAALALLGIYLLNKSGLLHETVSTTITQAGTVRSDAETGLPQFDRTSPETLPTKIALAVAPIDTNGNVTIFPNDVRGCTCPIGFQKYRDASNKSVWCVPN